MDLSSQIDSWRSCFYVYVDWTTEDVPRPFYVGKGKLSRVNYRIRNKHHTNIVAKYGLNRVSQEVNDEQTAFKEERLLIAKLHTYVYDIEYNGLGCNYTKGGEGSSGHVPGIETRQKMSAKASVFMLGNQNGRGHIRSSETRQRIKLKLLGHEVSSVTRKKISQKLTGRRHSPEHIRRSADGHRGKGKAVVQMLDNQVITMYVSAVIAENLTGVCRSKICECCKGRRKRAGGFEWCYVV